MLFINIASHSIQFTSWLHFRVVKFCVQFVFDWKWNTRAKRWAREGERKRGTCMIWCGALWPCRMGMVYSYVHNCTAQPIRGKLITVRSNSGTGFCLAFNWFDLLFWLAIKCMKKKTWFKFVNFFGRNQRLEGGSNFIWAIKRIL